MDAVTDSGISHVRSRRLALILATVAGALIVAALALALASGFPSDLVPSVGFGMVTAFVVPGLALSLLVDAAILATRDRPVTPNEHTVVRVVAVFAGIMLACAMLEGLWKLPGLEIFFLALYLTMGALAILVFFALALTVEIAVQTFHARRADRRSALAPEVPVRQDVGRD